GAQQEAIARWNSFWTSSRKQATISEIEQTSTAKGFVEQTHQPFYEALDREYTTISLQDIEDFDPQFYREFVHSDSSQYIISTLISRDIEDPDQLVKSIEQSNKGKNNLVIDRQALN